MKNIRFTSIVWLLLLPLLAVGKVFLELNSATVEGAIQKPFPISLLDTVSPANIIVAIVITFIATYFIFAYINAYVRIQPTYTVALFLGLGMLGVQQPQFTSTLIASILFVLGILQQVSLRKKGHSPFITFDTGLFMGVSLLFDTNFIFFVFLLGLFLSFTLRTILRFWSGVLCVLFITFPIIYYTGLVDEWREYFDITTNFHLQLPDFSFGDYLIILLFVLAFFLRSISLYLAYPKADTRKLLVFLMLYVLLAVGMGFFIYATPTVVLLLLLPALAILFGLAKTEQFLLPFLLLASLVFYIGIQLI